MNVKSFKVDVFNAEVIVIVSESMSDIMGFISDKYLIEDPDVENVADILEAFVMTLDDNRRFIIAFKSEYLNHNTITHELYHLAVAILERINIKDEETTAWVIGYCAEKVYKILNKEGYDI